jgi:neutral ceramidase
MNILRRVFLIIIGSVVGASTVPAQDIKANAVDIVLTPPLEIGYTLGGYGARMSKPAEGVHDDIRAKALVLDDGTKKYAIVTLDILGLPPNVKPQIVEKLDNKEWTEENILFLPSHAHTSLEMFALNDKNIFEMPPIGIFQPRLLDYVVETLAGLIRSTDRDLQPVKTGTSSMQIDGRNRNRRGKPYVDNYLTVTRIDRLNGQPLSVLVNWTAHPTIMDEDDMLVSGGWPGYLQRELEALIGGDVVAMYYNGAEGDQSVIAGSAGSHYEKAELYGRGMALEVMKVYEGILPVPDATFDYNYLVIKLPEPKAHPDFMETGGREYGLSEENIQGLLNQICPTQTSVGACRLGDLLIVGAPGEMIAELGLEVKNRLKENGVKHPAVGGLANQWVSYILSEEEYGKTGYENSVSFYGKELGNIIVDAMLDTANPLIR